MSKTKKERNTTAMKSTTSASKDKTIARIHELRELYGWSCYKLAQKSGIPLATLQSMEKRGTPPTIPVLEQIIVNGFGITFSEFFSDGDACILSNEDRNMIKKYRQLEPRTREALRRLIEAM